jgi:hypothetical protein
MGHFIDIVEHFKKVRKIYVLNKTKYFEMPSKSIKEQLLEQVENKKTMGMISYCKVKEHGEDPVVELVNDFVFIEDIFTVGNEWIEKDLMGEHAKQYKPWSGPSASDSVDSIINNE